MQSTEHFVTLFDNNFLPMGLCLHRSLLEHGQPFHLWVLCMDELVETNLKNLALPHLTLIPLRDVEDPALLAVKPTRSRGEYCWTLTPFVPGFVFHRDASIVRVTYLDADLFFFDEPRALIDEFVHSGRHVLMTEHVYGSLYGRLFREKRNGRYCVQFMTVRRTEEASKVMRWWQERCLEWCYARVENGKFGDQKYLDQWPQLFPHDVHVLQQKQKALAPWNLAHFAGRGNGNLAPVFYHFHGLRLISAETILMSWGYKIGTVGDAVYGAYRKALGDVIGLLRSHDIPVPLMPMPQFAWWRKPFLRLNMAPLVR
jgi:hypothetical protein